VYVFSIHVFSTMSVLILTGAGEDADTSTAAVRVETNGVLGTCTATTPRSTLVYVYRRTYTGAAVLPYRLLCTHARVLTHRCAQVSTEVCSQVYHSRRCADLHRRFYVRLG